MKRKKWKGSYTVEASLIVPLVLWVFALAMRMGISMHGEIQGQQEAIEELREVEEFYVYQAVGELLDD